MDFPSIDQSIGNTRLVRLQRMPGNTSNIILAKMEGDNPAGSVKDRPAVSMIMNAQSRGEIALVTILLKRLAVILLLHLRWLRR